MHYALIIPLLVVTFLIRRAIRKNRTPVIVKIPVLVHHKGVK